MTAADRLRQMAADERYAELCSLPRVSLAEARSLGINPVLSPGRGREPDLFWSWPILAQAAEYHRARLDELVGVRP